MPNKGKKPSKQANYYNDLDKQSSRSIDIDIDNDDIDSSFEKMFEINDRMTRYIGKRTGKFFDPKKIIEKEYGFVQYVPDGDSSDEDQRRAKKTEQIVKEMNHFFGGGAKKKNGDGGLEGADEGNRRNNIKGQKGRHRQGQSSPERRERKKKNKLKDEKSRQRQSRRYSVNQLEFGLDQIPSCSPSTSSDEENSVNSYGKEGRDRYNLQPHKNERNQGRRSERYHLSDIRHQTEPDTQIYIEQKRPSNELQISDGHKIERDHRRSSNKYYSEPPQRYSGNANRRSSTNRILAHVHDDDEQKKEKTLREEQRQRQRQKERQRFSGKYGKLPPKIVEKDYRGDDYGDQRGNEIERDHRVNNHLKDKKNERKKEKVINHSRNPSQISNNPHKKKKRSNGRNTNNRDTSVDSDLSEPEPDRSLLNGKKKGKSRGPYKNRVNSTKYQPAPISQGQSLFDAKISPIHGQDQNRDRDRDQDGNSNKEFADDSQSLDGVMKVLDKYDISYGVSTTTVNQELNNAQSRISTGNLSSAPTLASSTKKKPKEEAIETFQVEKVAKDQWKQQRDRQNRDRDGKYQGSRRVTNTNYHKNKKSHHQKESPSSFKQMDSILTESIRKGSEDYHDKIHRAKEQQEKELNQKKANQYKQVQFNADGKRERYLFSEEERASGGHTPEDGHEHELKEQQIEVKREWDSKQQSQAAYSSVRQDIIIDKDKSNEQEQEKEKYYQPQYEQKQLKERLKDRQKQKDREKEILREKERKQKGLNEKELLKEKEKQKRIAKESHRQNLKDKKVKLNEDKKDKRKNDYVNVNANREKVDGEVQSDRGRGRQSPFSDASTEYNNIGDRYEQTSYHPTQSEERDDIYSSEEMQMKQMVETSKQVREYDDEQKLITGKRKPVRIKPIMKGKKGGGGHQDEEGRGGQEERSQSRSKSNSKTRTKTKSKSKAKVNRNADKEVEALDIDIDIDKEKNQSGLSPQQLVTDQDQRLSRHQYPKRQQVKPVKFWEGEKVNYSRKGKIKSVARSDVLGRIGFKQTEFRGKIDRTRMSHKGDLFVQTIELNPKDVIDFDGFDGQKYDNLMVHVIGKKKISEKVQLYDGDELYTLNAPREIDAECKDFTIQNISEETVKVEFKLKSMKEIWKPY